MGDSKQTIEINGKRYDTETGRPVSSNSPTPGTAKRPISNSSSSKGTALDGFVRRPSTSIPATPRSVAPAETPKHSSPSPTASKVNRELQRSKTLMRSGVKRPGHKQAKSADSQTRPTLGAGSIERVNRAKHTQKSEHILKFSKKPPQAPSVIKKTAVLEVVAPAKSTVATTTHTKPATKQFENAVKKATSHKQKYNPQSKHGKARKILISSAAVFSVLLFGFLAFQMVPTIRVKLAGSRAGFDASLPSYSPAGFGLSGNIATNSGEVTLTYSSRTDDKNYRLTQTPSNWTSQALLNNFVIPSNKPYQTYEEQGKTVYIYDNSNATWIDGGIWYKLEGNANLTSDQLLRIANGV